MRGMAHRVDEKCHIRHIEYMTTYASIVHTRRKILGLSQSALALKAGLSRATVNQFERQGAGIGLEAFGHLLGALGLVMKLEPANEVVVKDWAQFETQRRAKLLAELRLAEPRAAPGRSERGLRSPKVPGVTSKVLHWGKL